MTEPATVPHTHSHGGNVSGALTRKYGPLPGYAYVVIIVAIGYVYYKRTGHSLFTSGTAVDPTAATDPSSTGLASVGGTDGLSGLTGGGPVGGVNGGPATMTNAQWGTEAVNWLVREKHANAGDASTAISRYLSGKKITTPSNIILVEEAIAALGPPPQGVLPIVRAPAPTPPPRHFKPPTHIFPGNPHPSPAPPKKPPAKQPPKSHQTFYVVRSGDTLSGIAARFYGHASEWQKIYSANQHVIGSNPNRIRPGMRLLIPA